MACCKAPFYASTPRTLEILATTRRRAPSPVSTLQTPEPERRSWAVAFLVLVLVLAGAPPGLVVRVRGALALELPLLLLLVLVIVVVAPLSLLVGAVHRLQTGRPADSARPVSRGSVCRSRSSLSCSSR